MDYNEDKFEYECEGSDGPVPPDILLEKCKEGKVDIVDIFISDITERYIEFVSQMQEANYEHISAFLIYASKLLELKSSYLLPKIEYDDYQEEDYGYTDNELFLVKLNEYKMLTEAAVKMEAMERLNRVYREPKFGKNDFEVQIKNFDLSKMIETFKSLLERVELEEDKAEPKTIQKERFTVAERMGELIESIRAFKRLHFNDLMRADFGKVEVINTFLALLEMLKQQIIKVEQPEWCGDIIITHAEDTDKYGAEQEEELLQDVEEYH